MYLFSVLNLEVFKTFINRKILAKLYMFMAKIYNTS